MWHLIACKNHFSFDPVQEWETNWKFTGSQVPHFKIVLIFFKPFLDNKMPNFEEYGAFTKRFHKLFLRYKLIDIKVSFIQNSNNLSHFR